MRNNREREKELSLICCVIRDNELIKSSLFQSFDTIFNIAEAFILKYGVDETEWGVELEYEETIVKFTIDYLSINKL